MAKKQNPKLLEQLEDIKNRIKRQIGNITACFFEQRPDLFDFDGIVELENKWVYLLLNAEIPNGEILKISKALEAFSRLYSMIKNRSFFDQ